MARIRNTFVAPKAPSSRGSSRSSSSTADSVRRSLMTAQTAKQTAPIARASPRSRPSSRASEEPEEEPTAAPTHPVAPRKAKKPLKKSKTSRCPVAGELGSGEMFWLIHASKGPMPSAVYEGYVYEYVNEAEVQKSNQLLLFLEKLIFFKLEIENFNFFSKKKFLVVFLM